MDDKTKSLVAHIPIFGWIYAIIQNQTDKGELTSFYLRQNLGFLILWLAFYIIGMLISWKLYMILSLIILVLWILSLMGAMSGEKKLTPFLGEMFQQWFKTLS